MIYLQSFFLKYFNHKNFLQASRFIFLISIGLFYTKIAQADYLDLSGQSPHKNMITVSWNYYSGEVYKIKWKKKLTSNWSNENHVESSNATLSGARLYYNIGALICATDYKIKAKQKGRGWREITVKTKAC